MTSKNTLKHLASALALVLASSGVNAAERMPLLAASQDDVVVGKLAIDKAALSADVERAPIDFAWPIDSNEKLFASAPFVAQSREFWTKLEAGELSKGYRFNTTAPGALVRISPAEGEKAALNVSSLSLRINGRDVDASSAIIASANAEQLKAAGAAFSAGTLAFRIAHDLGVGEVEVSAKNAKGRYLVHVFEPDSPFALDLQANTDRALAGGSLTLSAKLANADTALDAESLGGVITAPSGESFNVRFKRAADGRYLAKVSLPENAGNGMELWEAHAFAVGKIGNALVPRDVKTSFAVSRPTAKFGSEARVDTKAGVQVSLPVEAASAGRYEVRGVLYGTAADGSLKPFAVGHSARWLEAGKADITLKFGNELVPAGVGAPFELRDVSLNDQSRLGQLETRSRALRFGSTK